MGGVLSPSHRLICAYDLLENLDAPDLGTYCTPGQHCSKKPEAQWDLLDERKVIEDIIIQTKEFGRQG